MRAQLEIKMGTSAFEAGGHLPAATDNLVRYNADVQLRASARIDSGQIHMILGIFKWAESIGLTRMPAVGQRQLSPQNYGIFATCLGREALHSRFPGR